MKRAHLFACIVAASPIACVHGAERLVRGGVEGGIAGGLDGLNDPRNKELLLRLLRDDDIQRAVGDLAGALSGGMLDGLSDEERQARVREASEAYVRTVAAAVGHALDEELSPALARGVDDVVGAAVQGALRPANRRLAEELVDGVTRSAMHAVTQSTAQGLRDDLGPAMQRILEDNLGPALRKVVEEDLQPSLVAAFGADGGHAGVFARALTRQVVLGFNDGMSELGMSPTPNKKDGIGVLGWLLIVFGALLLVMTALLIRLFFTRHTLLQDRARSEEMLLNIMRAIEADGSGASTDAAGTPERQRPSGVHDGAYLASILGRAQLLARSDSPAATKKSAASKTPARDLSAP